MEKVTVFEMPSLYRDSMRITGYRFGEGEKTACIVGSMRGNEVQQLYCCSRIVRALSELEEEGRIAEGKSIMVIPCVNTYSMNTGKRFWPTDNSDINRMFPGYNLGETTQRIAAGLFEKINDYQYGMQFASFYIPGDFCPHVRLMRTGFESVESAKLFGLPYVIVADPEPYDTTTLNYNWQIWEAKAFSLYTRTTSRIDKPSAHTVIDGVMRFLNRIGAIRCPWKAGSVSDVIDEADLMSVKTGMSGIFESAVGDDAWVFRGDVLARVIDPYDGSVREAIRAPEDGVVFFQHSDPLIYADTIAFKLIPVADFGKAHIPEEDM